MDHLIAQLQKLGLTEKEAAVYLALLQLGASTPYRIAKKAHLKRPTAYVVSQELVQKGFIVVVPREKQKKYIARPPEAVFEEKEKDFVALKATLPELRSLQGGTTEKPSILYFEGTDGVKQALEYGEKNLHNKEIVGFYASAGDISSELANVFIVHNETMAKNNTRTRGITPDDPTLKMYYEQPAMQSSSTMKFIPKDQYASYVSIEACQTITRVILMESMQALIIESPKLSSALKQVFEMVWGLLGNKYEKPTTFEFPSQ